MNDIKTDTTDLRTVIDGDPESRKAAHGARQVSTFSERITIDAPRHAVWAALADIGTIAAWHPGLIGSHRTNDLDGLGGTRHCDISTKHSLTEQVVTFQPATAITFRITGSTLPFKSADIAFTLNDCTQPPHRGDRQPRLHPQVRSDRKDPRHAHRPPQLPRRNARAARGAQGPRRTTQLTPVEHPTQNRSWMSNSSATGDDDHRRTDAVLGRVRPRSRNAHHVLPRRQRLPTRREAPGCRRNIEVRLICRHGWVPMLDLRTGRRFLAAPRRRTSGRSSRRGWLRTPRPSGEAPRDRVRIRPARPDHQGRRRSRRSLLPQAANSGLHRCSAS